MTGVGKGHARGPVFVVGHSRSGTTLLASILNAHPNLACGPETAFFDLAGGARWRHVVRDPDWPAKAVRFLASMRRADGRSVLDAYALTPEIVRQELIDKPPALAAMLEALTVPYARARGKARWVEKSPRHLMRVTAIRAAWPDAAIVRIVRDPRGVAASFAGVPFGPRSAVGVAYMWRESDDVSWRSFESERSALTVRYEDLVREPEAVSRGLADFLDEPFDPRMLRPGDSGAAAVAGDEPWKARVIGAIDTTRVESWRSELSAADQARVALVCAEGIARYGYEGAITPRGEAWVRPFDPAFIEDAADFLSRAADGGVVMRGADAGWPDTRERLVLWGTPRRLRWTRGGRSRTLRRLARLTPQMTRARMRGRPAFWVLRPTDRRRRLWSTERLGDTLVRVLARRATPDEVLSAILEA